MHILSDFHFLFYPLLKTPEIIFCLFFTWISSRSVTQARARVRQPCRARMFGSLTGMSWASFTIASRVERGCFCLEEQNHNKEILTSLQRDKLVAKDVTPMAGETWREIYGVTCVPYLCSRQICAFSSQRSAIVSSS